VALIFLALSSGTAAAQSNLSVFELADGSGEVEWITPCSFRVARYWGTARPLEQAINPEAVGAKRADYGSAARFSTGCLSVEVEKATLRIDVTAGGRRILADAAPPRKTAQGFVVERAAPPQELYFGLGPRAAPKADLRGQNIAAGKALMISNLGYAESFPLGGDCTYDMGRSQADRRRVTIRGPDRVEYLFFYGPTPREALIEHARVMGTFDPLDAAAFGILRPGEVPKAATRIAVRGAGVHASWSALLVSALDLSPYQAAPEPVRRRAAQLASVVPIVYASPPEAFISSAAAMRRRLTPYLITCAYEGRQLGVPMIRPVGMQSPGDLPAAADLTDQFMLGDALLVAPVVTPAAERTVYLPAGTWTDLRTNRIYTGRQTVKIEAGLALPIFAKHIAVLPLRQEGDADLLELHYFSGPAAEYLLMEEDGAGVSQFHAAPAGAIVRLEVISAKKRVYEWVLHHAASCRRVTSAGVDSAPVDAVGKLKPGSWFYDRQRKQVRIRWALAAGEELIIHVTP